MGRPKKKASVTSNSDQHYEKVDDLPEERRKAYESILEDFDKQGTFNLIFLQMFWKFELRKNKNVLLNNVCFMYQ